MKTRKYRYEGIKPTRVQIVIPVMLDPLFAADGTKVIRTASLTRYCHIKGDKVIGVQGNNFAIFGTMNDKGDIQIELPSLLDKAHKAYLAYKKPIEEAELQERIQAILNTEPVLKEVAA